jgi:hypothetical protein
LAIASWENYQSHENVKLQKSFACHKSFTEVKFLQLLAHESHLMNYYYYPLQNFVGHSLGCKVLAIAS